MAIRSVGQPPNPACFCYAVFVDTLDSMKTPKQLSREAIEEFKAAYKEEFGIALTDEQVKQIAARLLRFFGILSKPE